MTAYIPLILLRKGDGMVTEKENEMWREILSDLERRLMCETLELKRHWGDVDHVNQRLSDAERMFADNA